MRFEDLKRDFDRLENSIRIEAIKENMRSFPQNDAGILLIKELLDLEYKLMLKTEPDSRYCYQLGLSTDEINTRIGLKLTSEKLKRESFERALREAISALNHSLS